jgi:hypothetical protein
MITVNGWDIPEETLEGYDESTGSGWSRSTPKVMFDDYQSGGRDIIAMTTRALSPFIPAACMGAKSVKITARKKGESGDVEESTVRAPEIFVGIAQDFIMDMSIHLHRLGRPCAQDC